MVVELINLCLWFFLGSGLLQLGTPLQVFYVVFTSLVETKFFVDACIWDEFLDDHCCAQTLHLLLVPCWTVAAGGSSDAVGSSELNPELNQIS